ncbi:MAG TPA: type I restriction enzyme HsdR N-terminal domain-containing protein [Chitinophagales bacterium]|nr:type I restriction enzyme HsdR N-terminal domain-containing protein [Chitinophagales bacterium]
MSSLFFKTKVLDDKKWIFDPIRKKFIVLTPEESVRQSILAYMVERKFYPINFISVEKQITYAEKNRRFDIVIYDKNHHPCILIECKRPEIQISQKTMEQAALYNQVLRVPYLVLTNGQQHFVIQLNLGTGEYQWLSDLPERELIWSVED